MAAGGYAWWYLDALSDDGRHGLTLIAFIGSVFSPYYAHARRRTQGGLADPLNHCSINIALYDIERGGGRWAMTERGTSRLRRNAASLLIGPSSLVREGNTLRINVDEVTAPWPSRIRGSIRVETHAWTDHPVVLDATGGHRWSALAPCARVDVAMSAPGLAWSGHAYLDTNQGDAPLESAFARWDWSRARVNEDEAAVFYDITRRDTSSLNVALRFDSSGGVAPCEAPSSAALPDSAWRMPRTARSDAEHPARQRRKLEDGPFYSRSLLEARWLGAPVCVVHESLCLKRFDARWVQMLLPFRMPRRA